MKPTPCTNCGTVRREIRARRLCTRCYPLTLLREKIKEWTFENLSQISSRLYPPVRYFEKRNYFEVIKKGYLRQLEDELNSLRWREESYEKGVDGITIEEMLRSMGNRLSPRYYKDRHYGHANRIDWTFPPKQKRELFRLLIEIEESIPWRGLSWSRALDDYRKHRRGV